MDIRQLEEQLALVLANSVFGDGPAQAILTAVQITRQDIGVFLAGWRTVDAFTMPFAILRVVGGALERDGASHPTGAMGKGVRQFAKASVWVAAGSVADPIPSPPPFVAVGNVAGDNAFGQGALIGKGVALGRRANQGVDRIVAELVRQGLGNGQLVDAVHGFQGRITGFADVSAPMPQVNVRRIDVEITNASTEQSYHAPSRVHAAVAGSNVTLSWRPPPARPDFFNSYVILRDGVQVGFGGGSSFTDPGVPSGAHVYSISALYDDANRPPTTWNRQSIPVLLPVTV